MKIIIRLGILFTGLGYILMAFLSVLNWISTTFSVNIGYIPLLDYVSNDLGYALSTFTIGMLFIYGGWKGPSDVKGLSTILVGGILATALFFLQLLIVGAGIADVFILAVAGEEAGEYDILRSLLQGSILLGLPALGLLAYSITVFKKMNRKDTGYGD